MLWFNAALRFLLIFSEMATKHNFVRWKVRNYQLHQNYVRAFLHTRYRSRRLSANHIQGSFGNERYAQGDWLARRLRSGVRILWYDQHGRDMTNIPFRKLKYHRLEGFLNRETLYREVSHDGLQNCYLSSKSHVWRWVISSKRARRVKYLQN